MSVRSDCPKLNAQFYILTRNLRAYLATPPSVHYIQSREIIFFMFDFTQAVYSIDINVWAGKTCINFFKRQ